MIIPDSISLKRLQRLHPAIRQEAIDTCEALWAKGIHVRVTHTLRTFEEQDSLYSIGRRNPGRIVTNAKAGQSYHNYGLALDFCIINKDGTVSWSRGADFNNDEQPDWMQVVEAFEAIGWEWGGRWKSLKDYPHLQKTFGHKTAVLQQRSSFGIVTYPILT